MNTLRTVWTRSQRTLLALVVLCIAPGAARAQITLTLDHPVQAVPIGGGTLVFTGTITNNSSDFVDADSLSVPNTVGVTDYFGDMLFTIGLLAPGESYSGNLFAVQVPAGQGAFGGTFCVFDSTTGDEADADYTVQIDTRHHPLFPPRGNGHGGGSGTPPKTGDHRPK